MSDIRISPVMVSEILCYEVRFPFSWPKVEAIRKIPGRWYEPEKKAWVIPGDEEDRLFQFLQGEL